MRRRLYSSFSIALLAIGLVIGALVWSEGGAYGQSTAARRAIELIEQGLQLVKEDEPEAAQSRFKQAEELAGHDPTVQYALGRGYEAVGDKQRALENYFTAALSGVREARPTALAMLDLRRVMSDVPIPAGYRALMESGQYTLARDNAPWLPAAYWAMAMQSSIAGKRSEASSQFKDFQTIMEITGLAQPFREWTIETEQVRYQIGKLETDFLIEAGFLDSSWQQRVRDGDRAQVLQVFGAVEPDIWNLSEEAMRYAYRFKTLNVAKSGAEFSAIQSAIDALARSGGAGQIVVGPGIYRESLELRELGRIVIRAADTQDTVVASPSAAPALAIKGGSRLVIDGLRLEGQGAEVMSIESARQVTLKHVRITGGTRATVRITDAVDIFLWRGRISGTGLTLRVERSHDIGVAGIRLRSEASPWAVDVVQSEVSLRRASVESARGGILVRGRSGGDCSGDCSRLTLDATAINGGAEHGIALLGASALGMKDSRISGAFQAGIYAHGARIELEGSVLEVAGQDAIVVQGGTANIRDNLIRAVRVGIEASGRARLAAEGNSLHDGEIGIQINEASAEISNNEFTEAATSAIYMRSPSEPWTVSGNKVSSSGTGIAVEFAPGAAADANCIAGRGSRIAGNTLSWNRHGIVLGTLGNQGGGSVCIEQNTLVQNSQSGLWLLAGGPSALFSKSIAAYNNVGIVDPGGRVRIEASAAYQNGAGDAIPVAPARGPLINVDPQFRDVDAGDYAVLASELRFRSIGAGSR